LDDEEYYHDIVPKKTIYLHHTAGGHRPDWTIGGWERDTTRIGAVRHVATAFLIGGKSIRDGSQDWDGKILECLPPEKWAHHLGTNARNNRNLNKESIGIEICNYGQVDVRDGVYFNYVNNIVAAEDVIDLGYFHRGFRYYHAYTDAQIESTRKLVLDLGNRFNIDVSKGMKSILNANGDVFALNKKALAGDEGIWTHTNVRKDKNDLSPQPKMINMLSQL